MPARWRGLLSIALSLPTVALGVTLPTSNLKLTRALSVADANHAAELQSEVALAPTQVDAHKNKPDHVKKTRQQCARGEET